MFLKNIKLYPRAISVYTKFQTDSLFRNSIYLISSQLVLAVLGFAFWLICARLFSTEQIGLSTTLISVTTLLTTVSQLGMNISTISYFSGEKDKNTFISTATTLVGGAGLLFGIFFVLLVQQISPSLSFVKTDSVFSLIFILFISISTVNAITDSIFIAAKRSDLILIVDTVLAITKLALPFLLIIPNSYPIIYSVFISVFIGMILSVYFIFRVLKLRLKFQLNFKIVINVWKLTISNYLSNVLNLIGTAITPIVIINVLGPSTSAYYYMPNMIISLLYTIPRSVSSSLLAESGDTNSRVRTNLLKGLKSMYTLMIPAVSGVILFGNVVLSSFGKSYSEEGYLYLILMALSMFVVIPNYIFGSLLNIKRHNKLIIKLGIANAVISLLSLSLLVRFGLIGIAAAFFVHQFFILLLNLIIFRKQVFYGRIPQFAARFLTK